jgi:acetyl/propionyl-CoA carboxylase alpha subunit
VPHQYDSLIAKLVVEGETREIALARLKQALAEFCIEGIATNLERLIMLVNHTEYTNMRIDTGWNPQ